MREGTQEAGKVSRALEVIIRALNGDLNTMRSLRRAKAQERHVRYMIYECKDNLSVHKSLGARVVGSLVAGYSEKVVVALNTVVSER